jgi:hypothetical protein
MTLPPIGPWLDLGRAEEAGDAHLEPWAVRSFFIGLTPRLFMNSIENGSGNITAGRCANGCAAGGVHARAACVRCAAAKSTHWCGRGAAASARPLQSWPVQAWRGQGGDDAIMSLQRSSSSHQIASHRRSLGNALCVDVHSTTQ